MNKENKIQICFITIFIVVISVLGLITLTNNDTLSVKEGRALNTFPRITIKNLMHSNFYTEFTNAFADQMAFREDFVKFYYLLNMQRYTGDVVKGEENQLYLSPLIVENKEEYIKKLTKTIEKDMNKVAKEVSDAGSKFIFVSVPRKDVIMDKYLPSTYIKGTKDYLEYVDIIKEKASKNVTVVDAYELFKQNQHEHYDVFYKTDHHINIRGGYYIFEDIIARVNKDGYNIRLDKLEDEYTISKRVLNGSYNRKIGQSVEAGLEELVLVPKQQVQYVRYEEGKLSDIPVFGDGDTYAVAYMGMDYAETVIDTENNDAPNILFVGTSYTNVLEALATGKFNKVVGIDYRHNKTGKSIADYVKEHDIDYTIFICSQSNTPLSVSAIKEQLGLK